MMNDPAGTEVEGVHALPVNSEQLLRSVEEAMAGLDFGSIVITVHAAKVVQLEVTRKRRFTD